MSYGVDKCDELIVKVNATASMSINTNVNTNVNTNINTNVNTKVNTNINARHFCMSLEI